MMTRRMWMVMLVWGMVQAVTLGQPEPSAQELPRWRGFNLLEMFYKGSSTPPFHEEDFQLISELGFNFVRLPMDYRFWIRGDDWARFNETAVHWIDQAIGYGQQYGVHVCLNFHRAPGYTVADPPEPTSLWTDPATQQACAKHWAYFARRYKGIPNRELSFNLLNEPSDIDPNVHAQVVTLLVEAIREEDPNRLVIADGLNYGVTPSWNLIPLGIAQATRGYQPFTLTHYKAGWVSGADQWAEPMWPEPLGCSGYLYGPAKQDMQSPMVIEANIAEPFTFHVRVGTVSSSSRLQIRVDGVSRNTWYQDFKPGPGEGPWKQVVYVPQWNIYQNIYDQEFAIPFLICRREIRLNNIAGDWMTITEIGLELADGRTFSMRVNPRWGDVNRVVRFDPSNPAGAFQSDTAMDRQWLWDNYVAPWVQLKEAGVGVIVGEWGAYNQTPHDVVLRWMEDCLENWQQAGLGWALWNFRGSLGVLDSGRSDVQYEDFRGHKLDGKMLDLLQRY
ncbi:MAG: cellulase family glycosylhydrolase [Sedimentisphaerales bacterium]|nr:cellulase family glycosylhydrolase [Sedimentisphaerales bacterium]